MLILGSSDSGKSTLLKQLKLLHGGGFTEKEKSIAIIHIRQNIFSGCTYVLSEISCKEGKLSQVLHDLTGLYSVACICQFVV